jgi:hypothetical protein
LVLVGYVIGLLLCPVIVSAHHEAIFGPQSSLVLSQDQFVSVQVFSRELGASDATSRETTSLLSAGMRISKRHALSFTALVPFSWITDTGQARTSGVEDILLGLRYRYDLKGLQEKWDREGNFLLGVGAIELNNGTIDHPAWEGPLDATGAVLASVERGQWSGIGYTVVRTNGEDSEDNKAGNHVFVGGGVAYTPNEDLATGRLFSYQAGWSFEHYFRDRVDGGVDESSGGSELLIHPTLVFSPGHGLVFFGVLSVPVWQEFRDRSVQDRYRAGVGVVYGW